MPSEHCDERQSRSLSMLEPKALQKLEHPVVRAGLGCWARLHEQKPLPAKSDINPRELGRLLANTALAKVIADEDDFELRIAGDAVARAFRAPVHGARLSALSSVMPKMTALFRTQYAEVVSTREPQGWCYHVGEDLDEVTFSCAEFVVLPLSGDGLVIDHILSFVGFPDSLEF